MKERVLALVKEVLPQIDFEASNALVDDGILDSLAIVALVSELSMEFDISIPYEEIMPDNFNSIDAICALVERLNNKLGGI